MPSAMAKRWKVLIIVGLSVALVDQWTKFLAVKHLTPGIAVAHSGKARLGDKEQEEVLKSMGLGQQLKLFYTDVKGPCRTFGARCPSVRVIDGFWNWRYVENPGAAWGILANTSERIRVPFFHLVSLLALVFIISYFRKLEDHQGLLIVSLSLISGGAVGNELDRIHLNYVIDFIDWYVGNSHWPTFNVADAAISTGVGLIALEWVREWNQARAHEREANEQSLSEGKS